MPAWYFDEPPKFPGDEFYLRAFYVLVTCRQAYGNSLGPIPWTAVSRYAAEHRLDRQAARLFEDVISQMDQAHVAWCEKRATANRKMVESAAKADEAAKQAKAEAIGG